MALTVRRRLTLSYRQQVASSQSPLPGATVSVPIGGKASPETPAEISPIASKIGTAQTKAQAMGIDTAVEPMSNAAAVAVDAGADVVTQQHEVDKQKAEAYAKEKAIPGRVSKLIAEIVAIKRS